MNGRKISFIYGSIVLNISDYNISAEDKLTEIALINGSIRTVQVGKAAITIKISGKLPTSDCHELFTAANPMTGRFNILNIDGLSFPFAMLDSIVIQPEAADGFSKYTMKFHV